GGRRGFFSQNWLQTNIKLKGNTASIATRWTRVVSPSTVNELKFSWQGNPEYAYPSKDTEWPPLLRQTYGFNAGMLNGKGNPLGILPRTFFGGVPNAAILGNLSSLYEWLPMDNPSNVYTVTENLSIVHNAHLFKAGIQVQRFWRDIDGVSMRYGQFDFG